LRAKRESFQDGNAISGVSRRRIEMDKPLDPNNLYKLMATVADQVGYLSGDSCKVLIALALRPESRGSMMSLKSVACIEDNTEFTQAVSDLENLNLVKFDGKGGVLINETILTPK
jgi:hypothetical protein